MSSSDMLFLSMVHPASPPFSVAVKIDRVYSVDHVEILGDGLPLVKTLSSVDVVVYDGKVIVLYLILVLQLMKILLTFSLIRHQR